MTNRQFKHPRKPNRHDDSETENPFSPDAVGWSPVSSVARGRGAQSNASGKFEPYGRIPFDDGWSGLEMDITPLRTETIPEKPKKAITYNSSPDISFDRTVNPYKGCEHGCIYCYARPTHTYSGLSAGLDFESRIFIKPNVPDLLRQELSRPRYRPRMLVLGGDTDIYQPIERELEITRKILKVLQSANHPFSFVTKSALVLRDLDILAPMAEQGLVRACVSLTSLDNRLSRTMEPRAAAPHRRLDVIRQLTQAGVPVTVMTAPIIPSINDMEIERLIEAANDVGADTARYVLLRLPLEIANLFEEWLDTYFKDRKSKIMRLMRDMRGGSAYQSEFNLRQTGSGPYADLIAHRFKTAAKRVGLNQRSTPLRTDLFCPPLPDSNQQLDLF